MLVTVLLPFHETISVFCCCSVSGLGLFWSDILVFCYKGVEFPTNSGPALVWKLICGPVFVLPLSLFQMRLSWLAIQLKLKWLRGRQVQPALPGIYGHEVRATSSTLNVVGKSLVASMIVILFSSFAKVFPIIDINSYFAHKTIVPRVIMVITASQHVFTALVYLALFPQFRAVSSRWFENLRCRRFYRASRIPTPLASNEPIGLQNINETIRP